MGSAPPSFKHETDVLVVGGGPVGMVAAYRLAQYGIPCMLIERNLNTTNYPKMELTSGRSMELFRRMDLAKDYRAQGVPPHYSFDQVMSAGLHKPEWKITTFEFDSPNEYLEKSRKVNDGSKLLEPYMRCSQIVFERWMKSRVEQTSSIETHFGWNFRSTREEDDAVYSTVLDDAGAEIVIKSKFVVGCDGAGSRVRRGLGLGNPTAPFNLNMQLVHFRSRDLTRLQAHGQFWHLVFSDGSALVAQDEKEIWTVHRMQPPNEEPGPTKDPLGLIYSALGSCGGPFEVKVDEVLLCGYWQGVKGTAEAFRSTQGRVFLAGDAAHQLTPLGGLGLNSGWADVFDIAWKLALVLKGHGGQHLLESYNLERRSVALQNSKWVDLAFANAAMPILSFATQKGPAAVVAEGPEGKAVRAEMKEVFDKCSWMDNQEGVQTDYRYTGSPVIVPDPEGKEPPIERDFYVPSTLPGHRAPHVYLADGKTSIFDLYGDYYTLVDFRATHDICKPLAKAADRLGIPIKVVHLKDEKHVREIWERDVVLIRPDGFVAWRLPEKGEQLDEATVEDVWLVATGRKVASGYSPS